jgi:hypothetical protein
MNKLSTLLLVGVFTCILVLQFAPQFPIGNEFWNKWIVFGPAYEPRRLPVGLMCELGLGWMAYPGEGVVTPRSESVFWFWVIVDIPLLLCSSLTLLAIQGEASKGNPRSARDIEQYLIL